VCIQHIAAKENVRLVLAESRPHFHGWSIVDLYLGSKNRQLNDVACEALKQHQAILNQTEGSNKRCRQDCSIRRCVD
jgi:hypothetical protein